MPVTFKNKYKATATASASTSTIVTTQDILPGERILFGSGRTALSTSTNGALSITTSAGAGVYELCGVACRTSTFDVVLASFRCTTLIPSGSTITLNHRDASTKRGWIAQVVSGLNTNVVHRTSGNTADNTAGNISAGPNGSSSTQSASTTAATTVADCLVVSVQSEGGTNTYTPGAGYTLIDESKTASGSADRGCLMEYKVVSATGVQTATSTISSSGGWAAVVAAFEIDMTPPPASGLTPKELIAGVWTALTPKEVVAGAYVTDTIKEL